MSSLKEEEIKKIVGKYIDEIPDIESQYVVNEGLSKAISHFFKGKIKSFPLYKISLKIDKNPVKIPWSLSEGGQNTNVKTKQIKYKKNNKRE